MKNHHPVLLQVLRQPNVVSSLALSDWDQIICQARHANLLACLYALLETNNLLKAVPDKPAQHLLSAHILATRQKQAVNWEINRILYALRKTDFPIVLLKGAAYVMANLPSAQGRLFSDVDILVPKDKLDITEQSFMMHGWFTTHRNQYDQRYYRKWMHELPPMKHIDRETVIDVHHTILPLTSRLHPDPEKLFNDIVSINSHPRLKMLSPIDMILHSATHLFYDGELEHGLRDLVDLDRLMKHFGKETHFWKKLINRAEEMQLTRPLYYALTYSQELLCTPVPKQVCEEILKWKPAGFGVAKIMEQLFKRALLPDHASCDDAFTGLARWLLYIRSHYLRMPLYLLIPHLLRKGWINRMGKKI